VFAQPSKSSVMPNETGRLHTKPNGLSRHKNEDRSTHVWRPSMKMITAAQHAFWPSYSVDHS
jgi:hypothetical protein